MVEGLRKTKTLGRLQTRVLHELMFEGTIPHLGGRELSGVHGSHSIELSSCSLRLIILTLYLFVFLSVI